MKYIKWLLLVLLLLLFFTVCLFIIDNKYEEKLFQLNKDNQNYKATIKEQQNLISSYVKKLKQKCEECDCSWYEDFYYEWAEKVGAFE